MRAGRVGSEKQIRNNGKYTSDKPKECRNCYFWSGKQKGCSQNKCYYLQPEEISPPDIALKNPLLQENGKKVVGYCQSCPYSKHSPCIGYCIQKILQEIRQKKQFKGKEGKLFAG